MTTQAQEQVQNRGPAGTGQSPRAGARIARFLRQLRERKVCRAAIFYAVSTWMILQLGEIVFPALGLPEWTLSLMVVLAALGFPVAMILAWLLQWTDDGLVIDLPVAQPQSSAGRLDGTINLALLVAAAGLSAQLVYSQVAVQGANASVRPAEVVRILPFSGSENIHDGPLSGFEQQVRHELLTSGAPVEIVAGGGAAKARWSLAGAIIRSGDGARILFQLIDESEQRYVWSASIDANAAGPGLARTAVQALMQETGLGLDTAEPGTQKPFVPEEGAIVEARVQTASVWRIETGSSRR